MDIEGVPKLFIALLHVLSCLGGPQPISPSGSQFMDWSINRQRIREAVKDSSLSTSTILEALHQCITDSNILPSWNASDDVEISMVRSSFRVELPESNETRFGVTLSPTLTSGVMKGSTVELKILQPFPIWTVTGRWCCAVCRRTWHPWLSSTASLFPLSFSRASSRGNTHLRKVSYRANVALCTGETLKSLTRPGCCAGSRLSKTRVILVSRFMIFCLWMLRAGKQAASSI